MFSPVCFFIVHLVYAHVSSSTWTPNKSRVLRRPVPSWFSAHALVCLCTSSVTFGAHAFSPSICAHQRSFSCILCRWHVPQVMRSCARISYSFDRAPHICDSCARSRSPFCERHKACVRMRPCRPLGCAPHKSFVCARMLSSHCAHQKSCVRAFCSDCTPTSRGLARDALFPSYLCAPKRILSNCSPPPPPPLMRSRMRVLSFRFPPPSLPSIASHGRHSFSVPPPAPSCPSVFSGCLCGHVRVVSHLMPPPLW